MGNWFYEIALDAAAAAVEYAIGRAQKISNRKKEAERRRKEKELADKLDEQLRDIARQADEIVAKLEGYAAGDDHKKVR